MTEREQEMESLLKALCSDIDAMRFEKPHSEWFGPFMDDGDSNIEWINLAILRDEIKEKLGF